MEDDEKRSEIPLSEEEKHFQRVAFGDLPRVTLRDDETLRVFEEKSPWSLIVKDQMFEEDSSNDDYDVPESGSGEEEHFVLEARGNNSPGGHSACTHTGGSVRENFKQPKNIGLASLQPYNISSFYTLTPENEHEISGSNANRGHECL